MRPSRWKEKGGEGACRHVATALLGKAGGLLYAGCDIAARKEHMTMLNEPMLQRYGLDRLTGWVISPRSNRISSLKLPKALVGLGLPAIFAILTPSNFHFRPTISLLTYDPSSSLHRFPTLHSQPHI